MTGPRVTDFSVCVSMLSYIPCSLLFISFRLRMNRATASISGGIADLRPPAFPIADNGSAPLGRAVADKRIERPGAAVGVADRLEVALSGVSGGMSIGGRRGFSLPAILAIIRTVVRNTLETVGKRNRGGKNRGIQIGIATQI